jgi:hypothetical protein
MEEVKNAGRATVSHPNDDKGLDIEEQQKLAKEVRHQAEESQRLQAELSQRPKCLMSSFSEFKFESPKVGTNF